MARRWEEEAAGEWEDAPSADASRATGRGGLDAFDADGRDAADDDDAEGLGAAIGRPTQRPTLALVLLAALGGAFFAGTSTADFVAHLDRQVHAVTCSVLPGGQPAMESGCRAVMLSPYSSWFRDTYWGGIPISLWALAVFCFIAYRAAHLLVRGRPRRDEAGFLMASTLLPVVMSVGYGYLAVARVGAVCTVCTGIYVVSGLAFVGALLTFVLSERAVTPRPGGVGRFFVGVAEGCGFVAALTLIYLTQMPQPKPGERGATGCGVLVQSEDPAGIMIDLARVPGGVSTLEVLDPLCPACRAFDERLEASGLAKRLDQRAVLFPLDSSCNWMVTAALHPGACAVSEAMLCAPGQAEARDILSWAFEHQQALMDEAKVDEGKLRARIARTFPSVAGCIGTPIAKNKVVKSLQWAVANALPVMTPQLFVGDLRLCDEDTDLGLEYTLTRMIGEVSR